MHMLFWQKRCILKLVGNDLLAMVPSEINQKPTHHDFSVMVGRIVDPERVTAPAESCF